MRMRGTKDVEVLFGTDQDGSGMYPSEEQIVVLEINAGQQMEMVWRGGAAMMLAKGAQDQRVVGVEEDNAEVKVRWMDLLWRPLKGAAESQICSEKSRALLEENTACLQAASAHPCACAVDHRLSADQWELSLLQLNGLIIDSINRLIFGLKIHNSHCTPSNRKTIRQQRARAPAVYMCDRKLRTEKVSFQKTNKQQNKNRNTETARAVRQRPPRKPRSRLPADDHRAFVHHGEGWHVGAQRTGW